MIEDWCILNELQENDMIYTKEYKTGYLFDQWKYLGPKRRKLLDELWAGLFRKKILGELPVDKIAPFFTASFGRPTKQLYTMLGDLVNKKDFLRNYY
jgi:hypothetical protein